MTGCASCLCASKTQQHVASWREAFSPGHYPSAARLRATTAADASAWATGGHDATTICAATAASARTTSSLPSAHAGAATASAGIAYTVIIWLTTGTRRTHDARKHSTHYASHTASTAATADGSDNLRRQHTNTDT